MKTEEKIFEPKLTKKPIQKTKSVFIENVSSLEIKDYKTIERTYTFFGRFISKLTVIYTAKQQLYAELRGKLVGELISNYSSESLVDVQFHIRNILQYITKPLINVKHLTLGNSYAYTGNESLPLNELFPAVKRLMLLNCWFFHIDYIDTLIPHLEHLSMQFYSKHLRNERQNLKHIENVLTKNAHIQSMELNLIPEAPTMLLESVRKCLPNIRNFTLWNCNRMKHAVHFENVTTLTIKSATTSLHNLHFPELENLHLKYPSEMWQHFLNEHNHLLTLHIEFFIDIHIDQYTADLSNLIELTCQIVWLPKFYSIDIRNLLTNHAKLMTFNIILLDRNSLAKLREKLLLAIELENEWKIVNIPLRGFSLQRIEQ